mmetsp:Transcript_29287/g.92410  ORF Transcript_29287/g.92410 Transcript_29287/m.92410 type:complete len:200 (+) Transcript_29287:226-825(+)
MYRRRMATMFPTTRSWHAAASSTSLPRPAAAPDLPAPQRAPRGCLQSAAVALFAARPPESASGTSGTPSRTRGSRSRSSGSRTCLRTMPSGGRNIPPRGCTRTQFGSRRRLPRGAPPRRLQGRRRCPGLADPHRRREGPSGHNPPRPTARGRSSSCSPRQCRRRGRCATRGWHGCCQDPPWPSARECHACPRACSRRRG